MEHEDAGKSLHCQLFGASSFLPTSVTHWGILRLQLFLLGEKAEAIPQRHFASSKSFLGDGQGQVTKNLEGRGAIPTGLALEATFQLAHKQVHDLAVFSLQVTLPH